MSEQTIDPTRKAVEPFTGPAPGPPDAIPVEVSGVVRTVPGHRSRFRTGTATAANPVETVQVIGADPRRRSMVIVNPTALPNGTAQSVTVWLLATRHDSPGNGFPLVPGASMDFDHQAEVFMAAPLLGAGAVVVVSFAAEME